MYELIFAPPGPARFSAGAARQNHATGLSVTSLSGFGQDDAGHIYAVSVAGPVYRLVQR